MNDLTSPAARNEDDAPGSPKRKKVRSKYAPKACVSCRRSKLKCSGQNPCSRCLDRDIRCFYSEDQTAAEALQNLSRPSPAQTHINLNTNGNGMPRRNILPRHDSIERRASDASTAGMSMEARMARIESMMESLIQERGPGSLSTRGSLERDEAVGDGFQGDAAFQTPNDAFNANLASVRQQLGFMHEMPPTYSDSRSRHSIPTVSPEHSAEPPTTVNVGPRSLAFPSPADYQKYVDFFFADINPFYSCVNEAEFRARGEKMLSSRAILDGDVCFLALHYIIFACSDISAERAPASPHGKPPGWQWFQTADELVGKRKISGRGDLSLIQFLVLEAVYLTHADRPNAAYNTIGLACRLCFQFSLDQQSVWRGTPFTLHMRQRIFWVVYFTDRRIALSCGRPSSFRDHDIDVDEPVWIRDKDLHPDQPLPELGMLGAWDVYSPRMVQWAKFAGEVWDKISSLAAPKSGLREENPDVLDTRIKQWADSTLAAVPLPSTNRPHEIRHRWQQVIIHTRFDHLRLLLRRHTMTSLAYHSSTGRLCGELAINIVRHIRPYALEVNIPNSFRFHMAVSLGSAILTLTTLLVQDLSCLGLQDQRHAYAEAFHHGITVLQDLAQTLQVARRIADDLKDVIQVVMSVSNPPIALPCQGGAEPLVPSNITSLFPYRNLNFAQQAGVGEYLWTGGMPRWNGNGNGNGAAMGTVGGGEGQTTTAALDSWDAEFECTGVGYGVPWI
ncbi:fungal-specific transcription factor domain-domain-containing protein [Clohesyomyces aquaticus]|uniref:Fungal-specific transcription factor domain-domain-containing protein n=1 Tax=Clohesyomyces aquaticus TaxID=1231657 RepID=A0A1Y1YNN1_9PLEO|nr:fungal-specific transcription factor domain-domain-containing protein [Clohesyomyces aquaticus]